MNSYVTPSLMLEYLYCPRFIYFMKVLEIRQHQELRFKVMEGRSIHKKKSLQNREYLRKKIDVTKKLVEQELFDEKNGINGKVDEILFLRDGSAVPLDYKFAVYKGKIFKTYKMQSLMYGAMIQANYGVPVHRGFIVFTRSHNHIEEVEFKERDYRKLVQYVEDIRSIIELNRYPKGTSVQSRCNDCCYRTICTR